MQVEDVGRGLNDIGRGIGSWKRTELMAEPCQPILERRSVERRGFGRGGQNGRSFSQG